MQTGSTVLHVVVRSARAEQTLDHAAGPLEFGRGPGRGSTPRCLIDDPYVSRDHLVVIESGDGLVLVENLSHTNPAEVEGYGELAGSESATVRLPVSITIGDTTIRLEASSTRAAATLPGAAAQPPPGGMATIIAPAMAGGEAPRQLHQLGATPDAATLVHWFETLVHVQQAAATSAEFVDATARAVVDLVGLDRGMVLLREGEGWRIAAAAPSSGRPFSVTILDEVVRLRRTLFRNLDSGSASASLVGIDAVAAAPILDSAGEVMGAVYGARELQFGRELPAISELEAAVLQVLAAAVGAGLAREQERERAMRARLQFEQFFTPRLADELTRDPALLAGRERELTVLFSDVRNFSRLSARLGPRRTFEMMQDVMDLQTERVRETDGVVVDYVGDGLLAMWNAPAEQPDHAVRACLAAIAIQRGLPALSERWAGEAGQPLHLGIGIHTGPALVGNTGSNIKFKYGPMGETVNLASRVENATKTLGVPVLVTEPTRARLAPGMPTRRIGPVRLEGFDTPIDLAELHTGDADERFEQRRRAYEAALSCFEGRRWQEACQLLAGLLGTGMYDTPSIQLLTRAAECLRQEPEQFDPAATIGKSL